MRRLSVARMEIEYDPAKNQRNVRSAASTSMQAAGAARERPAVHRRGRPTRLRRTALRSHMVDRRPAAYLRLHLAWARRAASSRCARPIGGRSMPLVRMSFAEATKRARTETGRLGADRRDDAMRTSPARSPRIRTSLRTCRKRSSEASSCGCTSSTCSASGRGWGSAHEAFAAALRPRSRRGEGVGGAWAACRMRPSARICA